MGYDKHFWLKLKFGESSVLTWHGPTTGTASSFLASAGAERAAVKHTLVLAEFVLHS